MGLVVFANRFARSRAASQRVPTKRPIIKAAPTRIVGFRCITRRRSSIVLRGQRKNSKWSLVIRPLVQMDWAAGFQKDSHLGEGWLNQASPLRRPQGAFKPPCGRCV